MKRQTIKTGSLSIGVVVMDGADWKDKVMLLTPAKPDDKGAVCVRSEYLPPGKVLCAKGVLIKNVGNCKRIGSRLVESEAADE